ncbi:MAG: hypothetical protein ACSLFP_10735 [Acidimicrobiales bacterium]
MKSPWKSIEALRPGVDHLALASSIPPHSLRSTGSLFLGSRSVGRQLEATDGVLGFSLLAEPFRKRYATISIWRDEAALGAFASTSPHRQLMTDLAPRTNQPRFVRWVTTGDDGIPEWDMVLDRLGMEP